MTEKLALFGGVPVVGRSEHRGWPIVSGAERENVMRVLDRGVLSGPFAPESTAFEEEFARFVGSKYALLTHSGTSALQLALAVAGVGPGDEVIVPAYSFVATPMAVVLEGAVPVFADVDLDTGCLEASAAAEVVTPKTRAIMPVHMHGTAADVGGLLALTSKHGVALVEDAAQAHGAKFQGKPVGALGVAGGFSMQSSKNLSAGEGGVFVTNDEAKATLANRVRNFGQNLPLAGRTGFDEHRPLDGRSLDSLRTGSMYRGNEMMAAFARAQLAKLPERTALAQKNAERLSRVLAELDGVVAPRVPEGRTSVFHKFRVRWEPQKAGIAGVSPRAFRDKLAEALRAEGLEVVLWQGAPLPSQTIFQQARKSHGLEGGVDVTKNYAPERYPNTQKLLDESLVLFSQSCPLIAQSAELVDRYAIAFARVWAERHSLAEGTRGR